jgi:hypothetical protein
MPRGSKALNNPTLLEAALEGLEIQKQRIEQQITEVRTALGRRSPRAAAQSAEVRPLTRRKPLSAAARQRIAAAQKKRWAKFRRAEAAKSE